MLDLKVCTPTAQPERITLLVARKMLAASTTEQSVTAAGVDRPSCEAARGQLLGSRGSNAQFKDVVRTGTRGDVKQRKARGPGLKERKLFSAHRGKTTL